MHRRRGHLDSQIGPSVHLHRAVGVETISAKIFQIF
jgi:hypothetical protein